jgi:hypothetical protein
MTPDTPPGSTAHLLSLTTWDWEKIAWAGLLAVALLIRLVALDNRTASHDEAQHAWFAHNLYTGKGYEHNPIYHGPFIYHAMALFYLLFGADDLTARIPTALFGFGIVWLMWLTRRWLGKPGAFFAAALITFSPALLHYSRHTRHDIYEIFWAVLMLIAIFRYLEIGHAKGSAGSTSQPPRCRWPWPARRTPSSTARPSAASCCCWCSSAGWPRRLDPSLPEEAHERPLYVGRNDWLMLAGGVALAFVGTLLYRILGLASTAGSATTVQTVPRWR